MLIHSFHQGSCDDANSALQNELISQDNSNFEYLNVKDEINVKTEPLDEKIVTSQVYTDQEQVNEKSMKYMIMIYYYVDQSMVIL